MKRSDSPRVLAYALIGGAGLLIALTAGRLELLAAAAPFVLAAVIASRTGEAEIIGTVGLDRARIVVGQAVRTQLKVENVRGIASIDVLLSLPDGMTAVGANPKNGVATIGDVTLTARADRWGAHLIGPALVRGRDVYGFHTWEATLGESQLLRVLPTERALRALVDPLETQVYVGNRLSRERSEGIEFVDLRKWEPGDRRRQINWRVSARRDELWVNTQRPDRNSDVVLFLDTSPTGGDRVDGLLDTALRAATALAQGYLRQRDRVGLVGFGDSISWLVPASGMRQLYRITDVLLNLDAARTFVRSDVSALPPRSLPPKSLVVALTPLIDPNTAAALIDLTGRGFDLIVFELDPTPFVGAGVDEQSELAFRLWRIAREVSRHRYRRAGVPIVEWGQSRPLEDAIEEATSFRRRRHARV